MDSLPDSEFEYPQDHSELTAGELEMLNELLRLNREFVESTNQLLAMPLPDGYNIVPGAIDLFTGARQGAIEDISMLESALNGTLNPSGARELIEDFEDSKLLMDGSVQRIQSLIREGGLAGTSLRSRLREFGQRFKLTR
jgi:hypothetical protein